MKRAWLVFAVSCMALGLYIVRHTSADRGASSAHALAMAGDLGSGTADFNDALGDWTERGDAPWQQRGGQSAPRGVFKDRVTPHWFAGNTRFWYRNELSSGRSEFVLVDAEKETKTPAFDHARLAASLGKEIKRDTSGDKLPFERIVFADDMKSVMFKASDGTWKCDLTSYEVAKTDAIPELDRTPAAAEPGAGQRGGGRRGGGGAPEFVDPLEDAYDAADEYGLFAEYSELYDNDDAQLLPPLDETQEAAQLQLAQAPQQGRGGGRGGQSNLRSRDGKWTAQVKDNNVFLRDASGDESQLTSDGKAGYGYGRLEWAPDSKTLIAFRTEPGERNDVYLIESSPREGGPAKLRTRDYPQAWTKFSTYEMSLFDVETKKQTKPEVGIIDFRQPSLRWNSDGFRFTYQKTDRGHGRFRVIEVDTHTGKFRNLIDDDPETFVNTYSNFTIRYLQRTPEIIFISERDGYRHIYLINMETGETKQVTKGDWLVNNIIGAGSVPGGANSNNQADIGIDEANRQIWFRARGVYPDQDPYLIHNCRVNFDGTGLVKLTAGNGTHTISYSPDRKHIIDTYSRVDLPPVTELRRVSDGKLVVELEKADVSQTRWMPPEVFSAKGRDGKTDIWGIIVRPRDFDPRKKYAILEDIYAGPQDSFVPKSFSPADRYSSFTSQGFIVVKVDGMGTFNRSKAFHDKCWKDLADAGFPDRIAWMKAAAEKYSYMDITRVGVYGTSAGGQNAAGAVMFHPEFYKAAVANCGCHDNRIDKSSWNEQWMGHPVDESYAKSSNVDNAYRLGGHLLLIVGELDTNVPPESTYRVVDALIKANRDFDLLVVPGGGHGAGNAQGYNTRKMQDFFNLHLQGKPIPDRNATPARRGGAPGGRA